MTGAAPATAGSRPSMRLTIGRRLVAGFAVPLVLLVVIGAVSFVNARSMATSSQMVTHTYEVLDETDGLLSALKDAETGQRGYIVTGIDSYLAPFTAARAEVDEHLDRARDLTVDNPMQQERFTDLVPLIEAKFAEMQQTIDVLDRDGFEAASRIVRSDQGKAVMDEIRSILDDVRADEQALLDERAEAADTAYRATTAVVLGGTAVAILLVVALATVLTRSITRPINVLTARLREIADGDGDLTARVDDSRRDEIGALAHVFNRFVGNIATLVRQIGETAATSSAAAAELSAITGEMTRQTGEAAEQASTAASAAEQVSASVQTVAAATEQMGASIHEIARSASDASNAGRTAVTSTDEANATISRLGESSAAIGGVVQLISSVAEQTNLLALNATIEAARAGEAGKGFAVVAGEVKELAAQTAQATEEITKRIEQIQSDVELAVGAIATTTEVIGQVNDHQGSIAGAVEEQTATTTAVSSNVTEAAAGTTTIADNVRKLADNAQDTVRSIDQIRSSADELARSSAHLDELVGRFRV